MDTFITIFSGVSVFVVGQFIVKALIEPYRDLAKVIGEIAFVLIFYANVYTKPGIPELENASVTPSAEPDESISRRTKQLDDVQVAFRKLASDLMARRHAIPVYVLWETFRLVPKRSDILAASRSLIRISNNMFNSGYEPAEQNKQDRREIERCFGLRLGFGT